MKPLFILDTNTRKRTPNLLFQLNPVIASWRLAVKKLIHYVQDMNKVPYDCVGQLEAEVYPLQEKYMLEMHGVKFEYDEFFVKLLSLCDSFNQNNF